MSKKRPNKAVTEKRKAKMAKKSYYASDAAKRKWEEKKARRRANNNNPTNNTEENIEYLDDIPELDEKDDVAVESSGEEQK